VLVLLGVARSVGKVSRLGSVATSTASATAASAAAQEEEAVASSVRKWEKRKRKQRPSRNRSKILGKICHKTPLKGELCYKPLKNLSLLGDTDKSCTFGTGHYMNYSIRFN